MNMQLVIVALVFLLAGVVATISLQAVVKRGIASGIDEYKALRAQFTSEAESLHDLLGSIKSAASIGGYVTKNSGPEKAILPIAPAVQVAPVAPVMQGIPAEAVAPVAPVAPDQPIEPAAVLQAQ